MTRETIPRKEAAKEKLSFGMAKRVMELAKKVTGWLAQVNQSN